VWEEQFGWSLVEAMASGLPIVASRCGAIEEVIGDHNILVNQNSPNELSDAFSKLAANKDVRTRIGLMNRARAKGSFDLSTQRLELDKVLISLIEG
jgi:glycosyltransferase involved in cell wall biosynthesis